MKKQIFIRDMKKSDLSSAKQIIDNNQMFPSEYIDGMVESYFSGGSEERWFVVEDDLGSVISIAYCAPERMTNGTWNLLLIAVLKQYQGAGVGAQLMQYLETQLKQLDGRVLLVETSGLPEYELTRMFYPKCGYKQIAVIPDYYDEGDDKVVYWKLLAQ